MLNIHIQKCINPIKQFTIFLTIDKENNKYIQLMWFLKLICFKLQYTLRIITNNVLFFYIAHIIKVEQTSKGKPKMVYNGYTYFQNCVVRDRIYWLCSANRKNKCGARIITSHSYENIKTRKLNHNHPPLTEDFMEDVSILKREQKADV